MIGIAQLVTTTPSSLLAVDREFVGQAHLQFTTIDIAIIGLIKAFVGQAHLRFVTPDDAELLLQVAEGVVRLTIAARRPSIIVTYGGRDR